MMRPTHINGRTIESGIIWWSMSIMLIAISANDRPMAINASAPKPKCQAHQAATMAVNISTMG